MEYPTIEITDLMRDAAKERAKKVVETSGLYTIERCYKGFLGESVFYYWLRENKVEAVWHRSYGTPDNGDFSLLNYKTVDVKTGHRKMNISQLDPNKWTMKVKEYQLKNKTYDYYVHVLLNANFTRGFIVGYSKEPKTEILVKDLIPIEKLAKEYHDSKK